MASLIPSLDSAVLDVLVGTESGLSATQIARLASRGSRQGQAAVLDRLVEHGLVIADPANRGFLYRLNRDHVLAPAVLCAARARGTFLERLTDAVATLEPEPIHVSVFGSFARREAGPSSDVDLLVVVPDDAAGEQWSSQVATIGEKVIAWSGNRLEYLIFTRDEFHGLSRRSEPIVQRLLDEAVTLRGIRIDEVLEADEFDAAGTVR